jgi:uncharacterized protein YjbI with pentapeptide repeats
MTRPVATTLANSNSTKPNMTRPVATTLANPNTIKPIMTKPVIEAKHLVDTKTAVSANAITAKPNTTRPTVLSIPNTTKPLLAKPITMKPANVVSNASISNASISNASISNASVSNASVSKANVVSNASISNASISKANLGTLKPIIKKTNFILNDADGNDCTNLEKDDIEEITINYNDVSDSISLKNPNEVYYEMYKNARDKAKQCRKQAVEAYLEAKQIKTKYMLDDLDDLDESDESDDENFIVEDYE